MLVNLHGAGLFLPACSNPSQLSIRLRAKQWNGFLHAHAGTWKAWFLVRAAFHEQPNDNPQKQDAEPARNPSLAPSWCSQKVATTTQNSSDA